MEEEIAAVEETEAAVNKKKEEGNWWECMPKWDDDGDDA